MNAPKVDVLAVMDAAAQWRGDFMGDWTSATEMAEARAAVVDLIDALRAMQRPLAELAHIAVDDEGMMSTAPITLFATGDVGPDYIAMACVALNQSIAALANIGPQS